MSSGPPPAYNEKSSFPQPAPPAYSGKNNYQQPPPPMAQPMCAPVIVGEYPAQCTCPSCRSQIVTRTEKKIGLLPWLICGGLTLVGFWPCACIPFCVDACKDTEHYCPSCNMLLGVDKRL